MHHMAIWRIMNFAKAFRENVAFNWSIYLVEITVQSHRWEILPIFLRMIYSHSIGLTWQTKYFSLFFCKAYFADVYFVSMILNDSVPHSAPVAINCKVNVHIAFSKVTNTLHTKKSTCKAKPNLSKTLKKSRSWISDLSKVKTSIVETQKFSGF